jgi:hypothetical protein
LNRSTVAGCITPGGDFLISHKGRPLLGCEKLLMQGIPFFRLLLGNETEVQLGDLAGNAMSLTVVCATMLAALTCEQLRKESLAMAKNPADALECADKILKNNSRLKESFKEQRWTGRIQEPENVHITESLTNASDLFQRLAELAPDAIKSSIWCTCETSGSNSSSTRFLECRVCRVSCCRNCVSSVAGYNLISHEKTTAEVALSSDEHGLGSVLTKLRDVAPPALQFSQESFNEIVMVNDDEFRVNGLASYIFNLHQIKRDRKKWLVIYYARENNGIGEAIAELRLSVGEVSTESLEDNSNVRRGLLAELTSFMPARTAPFKYGKLEPCARLFLPHGHVAPQRWFARDPNTRIQVRIVGSGTTDSPRVEVGLQDHVYDDLKASTLTSHNSKAFQKANQNGESRRWVYPKNWQTWPKSVQISCKESRGQHKIEGCYERADCRQSVPHSALWIKPGLEGEQALYILLLPNVNRTGPDMGIISSSCNCHDFSSVIAVFPKFWQPCDALNEKLHAQTLELKNWEAVAKLQCMIPDSKLAVNAGTAETENLVTVSNIRETDMVMFCRAANRLDAASFRLDVSCGQQAQRIIRVFNSVCAAQIMRYAAHHGLKYDLSPAAGWNKLEAGSVPFGRCTKTVPLRPQEEWYFDQERGSWERTSTPGAAREYYLKLQQAPQAFEFLLDKKSHGLTVNCYPEVVTHKAANALISGRGEEVLNQKLDVGFKMSDISLQQDPIIAPFTVHNCDEEKPTDLKLREPYHLYERQQKVVTKMLNIEKGVTNFEELEISEIEMPGK